MLGGLSVLAILIIVWLFAGERAGRSVDTNKG
jgi:hypothetical protein